MFKHAALKLLAGEFLCEVTAPEPYRWLSDEQNAREMDEYLGRLGRRLAATGNRRAYFAAWADVGPNERIEVRRLFATIKQDINPLIQFVTFSMDATHRDAVPTAGDVLDFASLLKAITDSPHLAEQVRMIAGLRLEFAVSDGTLRGILDRILKQLEKSGYLLAGVKGSDCYQFTGKIDYFYEVVTFLTEHEPDLRDSMDREEEPETGKLL